MRLQALYRVRLPGRIFFKGKRPVATTVRAIEGFEDGSDREADVTVEFEPEPDPFAMKFGTGRRASTRWASVTGVVRVTFEEDDLSLSPGDPDDDEEFIESHLSLADECSNVGAKVLNRILDFFRYELRNPLLGGVGSNDFGFPESWTMVEGTSDLVVPFPARALDVPKFPKDERRLLDVDQEPMRLQWYVEARLISLFATSC